MKINASKIIEILDPQAGRLRETVYDQSDAPDGSEQQRNLFESRPNMRRMTLQEAATLADFPVVMRDGVRSIAFDAYAGVPTTHQEWVMVERSDKMREDWVEENAIGELPIVGERTPYPIAKQDLDRTLQIANYKRGYILEVTEEMIRFNRLNILKRQTAQMGRSAANTREQACYSVVSTAGNYTRNSNTGDNDVGANTAATTFSATGLNTALATVRTAKDRKSGVYYGANPDTLLVTPQLEMAAKQLLLSPTIAHVAAATAGATVYGSGNANPFRGLINRIIVSPRLGASYQWVLMEAKQAVVLQVVDDLQILIESVGQPQHEGYMLYDSVRYRVRDWFGVGMLNDRFAYYSSSTSAPTVD